MRRARAGARLGSSSQACGILRDFVSVPAREMRETNGLLREELEGLRRRLGRQEKMQESLVVLELEKEVGSGGTVGCSLWVSSVWGILGFQFGIPVPPPKMWNCRTGVVG